MDKTTAEYKKTLMGLITSIEQTVAYFDITMKNPPSFDRGQKLGKMIQLLDLANDSAMHFGLGWGFKRIENYKTKISEMSNPKAKP